MILAALALLVADPSSLEGFYQSSTMEVGAAIQLEADGKFEYALDYGAVSEVAEGTWTVDGDKLLLTATHMEGAWKTPNFDHTPLRIEGNSLFLNRYDRVIRFDREGDPAPIPTRNKALEKGNR